MPHREKFLDALAAVRGQLERCDQTEKNIGDHAKKARKICLRRRDDLARKIDPDNTGVPLADPYDLLSREQHRHYRNACRNLTGLDKTTVSLEKEKQPLHIREG